MEKKKMILPEDLTWQDMRFGQIVCDSGADSISETGDWRYQRPSMDKDKCNKCGLCWLYCPDCSITPLEEGYYEPDLSYCKGCGICAEECPQKAITMIKEKG